MEKVVIKTAKFRNTQVNGRAVDYTVVRHKDNDNFIKDTNDECLIRIILTRFALIGWGFVDNLDTDKLIKITFPFAVKYITDALEEKEREEFSRLKVIKKQKSNKGA